LFIRLYQKQFIGSAIARVQADFMIMSIYCPLGGCRKISGGLLLKKVTAPKDKIVQLFG
jgi:hypothetical protein